MKRWSLQLWNHCHYQENPAFAGKKKKREKKKGGGGGGEGAEMKPTAVKTLSPRERDCRKNGEGGWWSLQLWNQSPPQCSSRKKREGGGGGGRERAMNHKKTKLKKKKKKKKSTNNETANKEATQTHALHLLHFVLHWPTMILNQINQGIINKTADKEATPPCAPTFTAVTRAWLH